MDNGKYECVTNKLIVSGIVQGVGFRPLTFRIAKKHGIKGNVRNIGGMVEIITQSSRQEFEEFLKELKASECEGCEIINIEITELGTYIFGMEKNNTFIYDSFEILESTSDAEVSIIPPDLTICDKCRDELYEKRNRRFKNPFISCMSCGPRYTIMDKIPYDRDNTTMEDFEMCPSCNMEYTSPLSRRFHAQTISCNDCGPFLIYTELNEHNESANESANELANESGNEAGNEAENDAAIKKTVDVIRTGGIVAVKGIGGYHFVCSPFIENTVVNLRKLKGREEKPFAVMFEDVESVSEYCKVSVDEKKLLESKARPIVLLHSDNSRMARSTCKDSIYCGAFLPYTPLQILLIRECGPLIMTSANISDRPIIKDDEEILSIDDRLLNGVLYNERRIVRSVDDSVARIIDGKAQVIRRSRGYVPYPIFMHKSKSELQILATGGDLKAAYCLYKNGNAVVSQYFGDLQEETIMNEYEESVKDLSALLKIRPDLAVCDLHPNYHSSKYAKKLGVPIEYVQHHHAHIASVMAEHNLNDKVIGIAFDGTGYGTDGNIWGGEFMVCHQGEYERRAHLKYTSIIGGDQSMRDAKKTAVCFLLNNGLDEFINDDRSAIIEAALKNNVNTILSSSMGRLFDAVASILDIQNDNTYEGECATKLEKSAVIADINNIKPEKLSFDIRKEDGMIIVDPGNLLKTICKMKKKVETGSLALGFHNAVADAVQQICSIIRNSDNINKVCVSGGVLQNNLLMKLVLEKLRNNKFEVFYNISVPPNDGSISLGQTYIGLMKRG